MGTGLHQVVAATLTLFQSWRGADYAHQVLKVTGVPHFVYIRNGRVKNKKVKSVTRQNLDQMHLCAMMT